MLLERAFELALSKLRWTVELVVQVVLHMVMVVVVEAILDMVVVEVVLDMVEVVEGAVEQAFGCHQLVQLCQ